MKQPWIRDRLIDGLIEMAHCRTDESNPRFKNNPLVTCLPGPLSRTEAQEFLVVEPEKRPRGFSSLPLEVRMEFAGEIKHVFVPAVAHIRAIQRFVQMLSGSYRYRNPHDPEFQQFLWTVVRASSPVIAPRIAGSIGPASGGVLIGPTGIGKSSAITRVPNAGKRGAVPK
ncbi:hypothetical protein [Paraburkholderia phytofirmans]|uniref:hypothetical protein n=1 Tax=Paraburkholderia phytofirmans TaxID=261302 RepID=UPI0011DFB106|nr:hypothetical protein [Paraburkholderia phytofirmans]